MTPALIWAAMRDILMFQWEVIDKVTRQCPQTTTFFDEKGPRAEAVSNRGPSAYQPNALPLGQTGSHTTEVRSNNYICLRFDLNRRDHRWAPLPDG